MDPKGRLQYVVGVEAFEHPCRWCCQACDPRPQRSYSRVFLTQRRPQGLHFFPLFYTVSHVCVQLHQPFEYAPKGGMVSFNLMYEIIEGL
jgi:hypothetical protein